MASSNRRLLRPYTRPVPANPGPPLGGDYPPAPRKNQIPYRWEIAGLVIGGLLSLAVLSMLVARYFLKRRSGNSSRTRNPRDNRPILFDIQDFADEDHGPELDHPIWHTRTVGLDRSIIDSIAVFKYRAGEGVTEGTDCSVCLNEFREDESLKLLPKCSHVFHVPCIDTWLQSHKNCPVCRAPIVRAGGTEQASLEEPSTANSSSNRSVIEENLDNRGISQSDSRRSLSRAGEVEANENRIEDGNFGSSQVEDGGKVTALPDLGECKVRVVSDLGDHCRVTGEEIQPVRRSVSVNSPSALEIYRAVAIAAQDQNQGTSRRQASRMMKSSILRANKTRTCGSGSGSSGSPSLYRMVKSCSFGASLNEEPASMKRSYSSSGNVRALRQ